MGTSRASTRKCKPRLTVEGQAGQRVTATAEEATSDSARTPCSRRQGEEKSGIDITYHSGRGDDPPDPCPVDAAACRLQRAPERAPLTASGLTPDDVARRWRVRWADAAALREIARAHRSTAAAAKHYACTVGLALAWIELDENPPEVGPRLITPRAVLSRAIYHARTLVRDGRDDRMVPLTPALLQVGSIEDSETQNAGAVEAVAALRSHARSDGQRAVVRAVLEEGCSTLAAVDRLYGWSRGTAGKHAERIRKRRRREEVSSPVA